MGYDSVVMNRATLPRRLEDLEEPALRVDRALRVSTARVLWNDRASLMADFPGLAEGEIEPWLLRHAALISVSQAAQAVANDPIATRGEPVEVYRLPQGGRAFFADTGEGLLSLKGVGVAPGAPLTNDVTAYGNGLFPLHELFKEVLGQWLVEAALRHAGRPVRTVPVYAALELGFDIRGAAGERWPAGVLVRGAHRRPLKGRDLPPVGSPEQAFALDLELLLRRYGITSVCEGTTRRLARDPDGTFVMYYYHKGKMQRGRWPQGQARKLWDSHAPPGEAIELFVCFEGINIQTTRSRRVEDAELVDFGSYRIRERFEWPLLSLAFNGATNWGGIVPLNSPHYAQPVPELAVPAQYWQEGAGLEDCDLENLAGVSLADERGERVGANPIEQLCFRLARAVGSGRFTGEMARSALATCVGRLTAHWPPAAG